MNNSPPLEYNYTERVVAQNNIDIEADNTISTSGPLMYDFAMPSLQTSCAPHKEVSNFTSTNNINSLPEPSPPMVISYSTNVLANPNLWDGNFTVTLLFGTNKFLQSNVCNMAYFLKQHSLEGHDSNNIPQLCHIPEI